MTARSDDVSPHEDRQKDENPCKVLEGLYIGAGKCAWNLDQLERFNITHVVNAAPQVESCLHASRVKYLTGLARSPFKVPRHSVQVEA